MMGDYSDDEDLDSKRRKTSPGPGAYQTMTSDFSSLFEATHNRPGSIQVFGSTVNRFLDKPIGCELGPG